MKIDWMRKPAKLFLIGGVLMTFFAKERLPSHRVWLTAPQTPFDRSGIPSMRDSYLLLSKAAAIVPRGATVLMRTEPDNSIADGSLIRHAVALLPGRRVLPAAIWNVPTPQLEREAEYLVLLGSRPALPPGRLLLETSEGSVWQRSP
jgi:hypothetical protein